MGKIRTGVIGCGRISGIYLEIFKRLSKNVEVVFAVDKVLERAESFAKQFEHCGYSDCLEDILNQPLDVVHVLTPHYLHKEQAVSCLLAGFHVLTEKPMALTSLDAEEMIRVSKQTKKQIGVISQNRYIDGIVKAKAMLEEGRLGAVKGAFSSLNWWRPPSYYQCDWKGKWETEGGGVVMDQAIHSLDLVRYLMGCEPVRISAHIDRRILTDIEVEDVADAAIVFENGAVYSFYACNYYTENSPIQIEMSCERGIIHLSQERVSISVDGEAEQVYVPSSSGDAGPGYWGNGHQIQIQKFYECLREEKQGPVEPEDAKKTLQLVLDIYRSAKTGKVVECQTFG